MCPSVKNKSKQLNSVELYLHREVKKPTAAVVMTTSDVTYTWLAALFWPSSGGQLAPWQGVSDHSQNRTQNTLCNCGLQVTGTLAVRAIGTCLLCLYYGPPPFITEKRFQIRVMEKVKHFQRTSVNKIHPHPLLTEYKKCSNSFSFAETIGCGTRVSTGVHQW